MGTGSTGAIAYLLDCGFVGVEKDPDVCKVAEDYLDTMTADFHLGGELYKRGPDGKVHARLTEPQTQAPFVTHTYTPRQGTPAKTLVTDDN